MQIDDHVRLCVKPYWTARVVEIRTIYHGPGTPLVEQVRVDHPDYSDGFINAQMFYPVRNPT